MKVKIPPKRSKNACFHVNSPCRPGELDPHPNPPPRISLPDPKFPKEFPETVDPPDHQISKGISGNLYQGQGVLSGPPGVRVVHFLPIRPLRRTSLLRLGSELSAVARQRCVLARSSSARRLARVAAHSPPAARRGLLANGFTCCCEDVARLSPHTRTQ